LYYRDTSRLLLSWNAFIFGVKKKIISLEHEWIIS